MRRNFEKKNLRSSQRTWSKPIKVQFLRTSLSQVSYKKYSTIQSDDWKAELHFQLLFHFSLIVNLSPISIAEKHENLGKLAEKQEKLSVHSY